MEESITIRDLPPDITFNYSIKIFPIFSDSESDKLPIDSLKSVHKNYVLNLKGLTNEQNLFSISYHLNPNFVE